MTESTSNNKSLTQISLETIKTFQYHDYDYNKIKRQFSDAELLYIKTLIIKDQTKYITNLEQYLIDIKFILKDDDSDDSDDSDDITDHDKIKRLFTYIVENHKKRSTSKENKPAIHKMKIDIDNNVLDNTYRVAISQTKQQISDFYKWKQQQQQMIIDEQNKLRNLITAKLPFLSYSYQFYTSILEMYKTSKTTIAYNEMKAIYSELEEILKFTNYEYQSEHLSIIDGKMMIHDTQITVNTLYVYQLSFEILCKINNEEGLNYTQEEIERLSHLVIYLGETCANGQLYEGLSQLSQELINEIQQSRGSQHAAEINKSLYIMNTNAAFYQVLYQLMIMIYYDEGLPKDNERDLLIDLIQNEYEVMTEILKFTGYYPILETKWITLKDSFDESEVPNYSKTSVKCHIMQYVFFLFCRCNLHVYNQYSIVKKSQNEDEDERAKLIVYVQREFLPIKADNKTLVQGFESQGIGYIRPIGNNKQTQYIDEKHGFFTQLKKLSSEDNRQLNHCPEFKYLQTLIQSFKRNDRGEWNRRPQIINNIMWLV